MIKVQQVSDAQVYTSAEVDAKIAAIPTADTYTRAEIDAKIERTPVIVPTFAQLLGPVQVNGVSGPWGGAWVFPSPVTSSTKLFSFQANIAHVAGARWVLVWTPRSTNAYSRLIAFDYAQDGVALNAQSLAEIRGDGRTTPLVFTADITAHFNALVDAKTIKHIGFQMIDDGVTSPTVYESRLELNYIV